MSRPIFHLAFPGDWARSSDTYEAPSLEEQGFIHCSTAEQLPRVAYERFKWRNDLILLTIDAGALPDGTLVYEDLDNLGEEYPHVYGPIPTSAVVMTGPYLSHLEVGLWAEDSSDRREWLEMLLHPDFSEVGRTGQSFSRQSFIAAGPEAVKMDLPLDDYQLDLIDEDVALIRYVTHGVYEGAAESTHRTSIWVNTNEGWRLRFHQGTRLP